MTLLVIAFYLNIKVIWYLPRECRLLHYMGCYYWNTNTVYVDGDRDMETKNFILGHELGHACAYHDEDSASAFGAWLRGATSTRDTEFANVYWYCHKNYAHF